jgi:hypothetical protein
MFVRNEIVFTSISYLAEYMVLRRIRLMFEIGTESTRHFRHLYFTMAQGIQMETRKYLASGRN